MAISLSHHAEATQGPFNPAKDFEGRLLPAGVDAARRITTDRSRATEAGRHPRVADERGRTSAAVRVDAQGLNFS